jgi:hypothetical protein
VRIGRCWSGGGSHFSVGFSRRGSKLALVVVISLTLEDRVSFVSLLTPDVTAVSFIDLFAF